MGDEFSEISILHELVEESEGALEAGAVGLVRLGHQVQLRQVHFPQVGLSGDGSVLLLLKLRTGLAQAAHMALRYHNKLENRANKMLLTYL